MGGSLSTPERILAAARVGDCEGVKQAIEFGRGRLQGLHNASSTPLASDSGASLRSSRLLEAVDEKGWTALVHAAHLGKVDIVELLLSAGADPNHTTPLPSGITPLHAAASANRTETALLLVRLGGANPFIEDGRGATPIDVAARDAGNAALARELEDSCSDGRLGCVFAGELSVKTPRKKSLMSLPLVSTTGWKTRFCVAVPRYPCSLSTSTSSSSSSSQTIVIVRRTLSIYKSRDAIAPLLRVWLDGAVAALEEEAEEGENGGGEGSNSSCGSPFFRGRQRRRQQGNNNDGTSRRFAGPRARLALHPSHPPLVPVGVVAAEEGDTVGGSVLRFGVAETASRSRSPSIAAAGVGNVIGQEESAAIAAAEAVRAFVAAVNRGGGGGGGGGLIVASTSAATAAPSEDDDSTVARRLQEQYDAEAASYLAARPPPQQLQQQQGPSTSPSQAPPAAPTAPPPPSVCPSSSTFRRDRPASAASAPSLPLLVQGLGLGAASTSSSPSASRPAAGVAAVATSPSRSSASPSPTRASTTARHSPGDGSSWRQRQQEESERATTTTSTTTATAQAVVEVVSNSENKKNEQTLNDDDPSESCVICMAAPATAGLLHGDSMHVCCCGECARGLVVAADETRRQRQGEGDEESVARCPVCREKIDRVVMRVYSTGASASAAV